MDGHTIVSIDEVVVATRHTLQNQVHSSHIIINRLKAAIRETDCEVQRLDADKDITINDLHSCIQRVQQHIDQCKEKATNAILQYHKTEENELHNKRSQLREALHLLESDVTQSEEVAKNGDINDLQTSVQKLAKINEITNSDFDLFNLIKSCFSSNIMSGTPIKDDLCEIGLTCLQSNLPTSVEFEVCDAIAGLTSVITVKLFDMIRNKVPFAVSFLAINITDPWQNKLPVSLNKTHPDCTVTFTPQRSGKHVISMQYLGEKLNCNQTNIMVRSNDPVFKFGNRGNGNGTFRFPNSIRIDHNKCLYVCDPENRLIQKFTVDGEFLSQFQVDVNGANCCALDMAVDEDKGIILCPEVFKSYYSFTKGHKVLVFDLEGKLREEDTNNRLYLGAYVTINNNGEVITCDHTTNSVFIQDKQGNIINEIRKPNVLLYSPSFMCILKDNGIILSDTYNNCIKIFNSKGEYVRQIGSYGNKVGQLSSPRGVATDGKNILVADGNNHRIQVFKLDGTFVSMIESYEDPLDQPRGLAVTNDGHVYVVDKNRHCIKKYKYMGMTK